MMIYRFYFGNGYITILLQNLSKSMREWQPVRVERIA